MQNAPGTGSAGLFRRSNPPSMKTLTLRTSTPSLSSGTTSKNVGRGRSESDEVTRVVRCCGSGVALPQSINQSINQSIDRAPCQSVRRMATARCARTSPSVETALAPARATEDPRRAPARARRRQSAPRQRIERAFPRLPIHWPEAAHLRVIHRYTATCIGVSPLAVLGEQVVDRFLQQLLTALF